MSDVLALYLVLVALYVSECLAWVPRSATCFASARDRSYRPIDGQELFGNERGGILPVSPLPLVGSTFLCRFPWPPALPDGEKLSRVKRRLQLWHLAVAPLRVVCSLLLFYVFAYCPFVIWLRGLASTWLALLAVLIGLVAIVGLQFRWSHRRLYPHNIPERRSRLILMSLSPLAAMRAAEALTRPLLETTHPLTAALALCDPGGASAVARRWLADTGLAASALDDHRAATDRPLRDVERLLNQAGLSLSAVLAPPAPENGDCRSYCPRCQCQYARAEGLCSACAGIALRPLPG